MANCIYFANLYQQHFAMRDLTAIYIDFKCLSGIEGTCLIRMLQAVLQKSMDVNIFSICAPVFLLPCLTFGNSFNFETVLTTH